MMSIVFHAEVLGNVVYRSSKASVIAMVNTLCTYFHIVVVGRFSDCWSLCKEFQE